MSCHYDVTVQRLVQCRVITGVGLWYRSPVVQVTTSVVFCSKKHIQCCLYLHFTMYSTRVFSGEGSLAVLRGGPAWMSFLHFWGKAFVMPLCIWCGKEVGKLTILFRRKYWFISEIIRLVQVLIAAGLRLTKMHRYACSTSWEDVCELWVRIGR